MDLLELYTGLCGPVCAACASTAISITSYQSVQITSPVSSQNAASHGETPPGECIVAFQKHESNGQSREELRLSVTVVLGEMILIVFSGLCSSMLGSSTFRQFTVKAGRFTQTLKGPGPRPCPASLVPGGFCQCHVESLIHTPRVIPLLERGLTSAES